MPMQSDNASGRTKSSTRSRCRGGVHLWHCYKNPFNLLLTVLAVVSWLSDDMQGHHRHRCRWWCCRTLIRFVQEGQAQPGRRTLKAMVSNTATVMRRDAGTEAAQEKRFAVRLR